MIENNLQVVGGVGGGGAQIEMPLNDDNIIVCLGRVTCPRYFRHESEIRIKLNDL